MHQCPIPKHPSIRDPRTTLSPSPRSYGTQVQTTTTIPQVTQSPSQVPSLRKRGITCSKPCAVCECLKRQKKRKKQEKKEKKRLKKERKKEKKRRKKEMKKGVIIVDDPIELIDNTQLSEGGSWWEMRLDKRDRQEEDLDLDCLAELKDATEGQKQEAQPKTFTTALEGLE
ncbi:hypothetical protein C7212DRAFT_364095 [Tuber magnatum]|uniref:Uncharacterized protein n=1 Tax=Tuber magnatum TaxID=42249 RepID=A0A317ST43_9PEZI|nr:hypothetical protein C7212DRAFT_364095 [Tuber magnatum]